MFCEKCGCTLPDGVSFCTQCGASLNSNAATPTAEAAGLRTELEVLKYQLGISNSLSNDELAEYIQYKQLKSIITIRKCVVFFTVLTVISLVCGLILALSASGSSW